MKHASPGPVRGVALALALAAIAAIGCGAAPDARPHLVLVVIDALRADHVGAYGYARPTSPHLDALAASGTLFTRASATSSWTRPSVASLFTSRLPSEHGANTMRAPLDPTLPTLAEELADAGYATIGVSANFVHVTTASGLARGFAAWHAAPETARGPRDALWTVDGEGGAKRHLRAPRAAEVNAYVAQLLPDPSAGPVFLYVHYMEPHTPLQPSAEMLARFRSERSAETRGFASNDEVLALASGQREARPGEREGLLDLYDAEVASADAGLGELVELLRARGYADDLRLVVTADHGEEFGEHGSYFHGKTLHAESLRVPLVVYDTQRTAPGVHRDEPVDLMDVTATLLQQAGLEAGPGRHGRSLLQGGELASRDVIAELHPDPLFERNAGARSHRLALERWPFKAIVSRRGEPGVYRVDRDPGELRPLAADEVPEDLFEAAAAHGAAQPASPGGSEGPLGAEEEAALRALGYVR